MVVAEEWIEKLFDCIDGEHILTLHSTASHHSPSPILALRIVGVNSLEGDIGGQYRTGKGNIGLTLFAHQNAGQQIRVQVAEVSVRCPNCEHPRASQEVIAY
jgi:hypothetical protein